MRHQEREAHRLICAPFEILDALAAIVPMFTMNRSVIRTPASRPARFEDIPEGLDLPGMRSGEIGL